MADVIGYKVKLDNNAVTVYHGADPYFSLPVSLDSIFSETYETYFNKITIASNGQLTLPQLNGSVVLSFIVKRKPSLSTSLIVPADLNVVISSNLILPAKVGEFNTWSFSDGIKDVLIKNNNLYDVSLEVLAVKNPTVISHLPSPPTFIGPDFPSVGSIILNWAPNVNDGNARVIAYRLSYNPTFSPALVTIIPQINDVYRNEYQIDNLTVGLSYDFILKEVNLIGESTGTVLTLTLPASLG